MIYKCVCAVCVRNLAKYIFGLCIYSGCEKTSGSVHLPSGFVYPLAVKESLVVYIFPLAVCILWLWKNIWMCLVSILWHYVSSVCVQCLALYICVQLRIHCASWYIPHMDGECDNQLRLPVRTPSVCGAQGAKHSCNRSIDILEMHTTTPTIQNL